MASPGDLKWFKKITMGSTILMGRKTGLPARTFTGKTKLGTKQDLPAEDGMQVFDLSMKSGQLFRPKRLYSSLGVGRFIH